MRKLSLWRTLCLVCILGIFAAIGSATETFTTLVNFNGTDGAGPYDLGSLVQGFDGNFYGTTLFGGADDDGTVFEITPAGKLTTLHSFDGTAGSTNLEAGLMQATNGNFYGTTIGGGADGDGTVFEITPAGKLTTLHSFGGTDGAFPEAGLVQATNGNLYGTTSGGGADGDGTVFEITPAGKLTTLHSFCSPPNCTDGAFPEARLVQATNGNFYGTTSGGDGTVFEITPAGKLTTLHSFGGTDGAQPVAGLVQVTNGNLYGTTSGGGADGDGTVFEITPAGKLTTLHSFDGTDGASPYAGLVQATNGNFYGTTLLGGTSSACNCGTIFEITPAGKLTTLRSFGGTDGFQPFAGLMQATNGNLYGTTSGGGADGDGTVFRLAVGLGPFVETLPTSGKVGTAVIILGYNLTGTSSVNFNGTAAAFTVVPGGTEITTTVPSGATTGPVKVTTPSRTLTSNINFRVTPTISSFSPTSGPIGTNVMINGETFTGTTSITFGGVKANFTVNSDTQIIAAVPTGAKTGKIAVTTPGGTATSSGTFTVTT